MQFYRNIRRICVIVFFHNLIPAYVIERLYWQSRGCSVSAVVYCGMIYAAVTLLLEIPSGAMADVLGRKKLLVAAGVMSLLEFGMLLSARHFWQFAVSVMLAGVGTACASGSLHALLYDTLVSCGRRDAFLKIIGRVRALDYAASIAAALSGGVLAAVCGYALNYRISLLSAAVALVMTFFLKEPPRSGSGEDKPSIRGTVNRAVAFFKGNTGVLTVMIHAVTVAAIVVYADEFWQLYLDGLRFPVALFGPVSVSLLLVRIPAAMLSQRLSARYSIGKLLIGCSCIVAAGMITLAVIRNPAGIAAMAVVFFGAEVMNVLVTGYLHGRADGDARATIESFGSLLERGCSVGIGLLFGYVADRTSVFTGFLALGTACALLSIIYGCVYRKRAFR